MPEVKGPGEVPCGKAAKEKKAKRGQTVKLWWATLLLAVARSFAHILNVSFSRYGGSGRQPRAFRKRRSLWLLHTQKIPEESNRRVSMV